MHARGATAQPRADIVVAAQHSQAIPHRDAMCKPFPCKHEHSAYNCAVSDGGAATHVRRGHVAGITSCLAACPAAPPPHSRRHSTGDATTTIGAAETTIIAQTMACVARGISDIVMRHGKAVTTTPTHGCAAHTAKSVTEHGPAFTPHTIANADGAHGQSNISAISKISTEQSLTKSAAFKGNNSIVEECPRMNSYTLNLRWTRIYNAFIEMFVCCFIPAYKTDARNTKT